MKAIGVVGVVSKEKFVGMVKSHRKQNEHVEIPKHKSTRQSGSVQRDAQKNVKIGYAMSLSKSKILKLEHEITRITDRIADIEFEVTHINPTELLKKGELMVERRRAIDKLRHLKDDLYRLKVDNINES